MTANGAVPTTRDRFDHAMRLVSALVECSVERSVTRVLSGRYGDFDSADEAACDEARAALFDHLYTAMVDDHGPSASTGSLVDEVRSHTLAVEATAARARTACPDAWLHVAAAAARLRDALDVAEEE